MSGRFTNHLVQLNVETEEMGAAFSPDLTRILLDGHAAGVVSAAFSADHRRAFSCDWSGGIRVWDLAQ